MDDTTRERALSLAGMIERLDAVYAVIRTTRQAELYLAEWMSSFHAFPMPLIRQAVEDWIDADEAFAPRIGQLRTRIIQQVEGQTSAAEAQAALQEAIHRFEFDVSSALRFLDGWPNLSRAVRSLGSWTRVAADFRSGGATQASLCLRLSRALSDFQGRVASKYSRRALASQERCEALDGAARELLQAGNSESAAKAIEYSSRAGESGSAQGD